MMRLFNLLPILIAAIVTLAAGAAAAGTPVQLKDQLLDDDGRITLGDIFDNAGRAEGVLLAAGPRPGGNVVLDAQRVQLIARVNGLDWPNSRGFRRLVIKNGSAGNAGAAAPGSRATEALTYTRSLAAGDIVQPEDVAWTPVQSHLVPGDAPQDAEAVIGQAARRALREGSPVAARDLSKPIVVKTNDLITVTYNIDGVSLSLQGKALQGGAAGDSISVLNPQSKKTIAAVVSGPGQAVVGPEAEALRYSTRSASIR